MPEQGRRMRCRRCHLTIDADELEGGYCPECYEVDGVRHTDFEVLESPQRTRYRCEQCGAVIDYQPRKAPSAKGQADGQTKG